MAAEIARVVLDRPTKANALTAKGMRDLAQRIEEAGARANTGIVVIEGRGDKGFCAGADIVEFASGPDALRDQGAGLVGIAKAISGSKSPVLSLIYGRTLGAGGMIAALSDIVVAADSLVFGFPEMVFSMYPAMMHSALLSRVSASLAWQLCASGRLLNAPQALDLGIVTEVLPADQFAQAAEEWVKFYAERSCALGLARQFARTYQYDSVQAIEDSIPIMMENFALPGVLEKIRGHLKPEKK